MVCESTGLIVRYIRYSVYCMYTWIAWCLPAMTRRSPFLGLLAAATLALCGEADTEAVPQSTLAGDEGFGQDDLLPPSPSQQAPLPGTEGERSAAEGTAAAEWQASDKNAWLRLKGLMASMRVSEPGELLHEAAALRNGSNSRRKRPRSALPLLQAIADAANHSEVPRANSTSAELELGHMYFRAEGVDHDVARAVAHYTRAAEEGEPEAQHALGVLYSTGFGVERDPALAATYLHFAAEGGSVGAQLISACPLHRPSRFYFLHALLSAAPKHATPRMRATRLTHRPTVSASTVGYRHLLGVSVPKQCFKSLLYYRPVAERVVAEAQRTRGSGGTIEKVRLTTDNPKGTMKRGADDDVLQYYEQSALKGSVDAQLTLGHLHYHGARGLPADVSKAFEYYSKAAAAGEPSAFSHVGNMYAQGVGVAQNNETALDWFRRGAGKDHPPSQNGLGFMYMHGHGVDRDYKKALEYFKAAAERGNAEAQFNLGAMHIGGMGVRKAHDKALHYFTLAAHQGHTLALYNLGQMHLNGLGAPRSCPIGVQFLKAVAERGPWGSSLEEAHAALQTGGPDVPLQLYASLAEGGFELAQSNIAFLIDQHLNNRGGAPLLGMQADALAERANAYYKLAAQQGNVEAELKLGDYSFYGLGQESDLERAVAHYRTASESRSAQAMFNLAYMYAHGLGLSRDYHLAKRHYDIALETAVEAWAPVNLAMLELKALIWWEERTGGGVGDPYEYGATMLAPAISMLEPLAELEYDTVLILVLAGMLAVILLVRQRRELT